MLKDTISFINYMMHDSFCNNDELVLAYHSVGDIERINDRNKINLRPDLFKKQIDFLNCFKKERVILTFDDGFANFLDNVFPLILKYRIKTILFIATDFIENRKRLNIFFDNKHNVGALNWKQVKEIANAGIEIGSHTKSHSDLTKLDSQALYNEIADSKKIIEDVICRRVKYFAYPYGARQSFNEHIKQIVKETGYEKAYTNIMGFNVKDFDWYELRRIRIYSDDNMFRFRMKIKGAYNWIDW